MPRVFFALWPDDAERDHLFEAAQSAHPASGGRLMRRENLHQTVVFIGNVTDARLKTLQAAPAPIRLPAFTLKFGTLHYWRHNHIVWAAPLETPAPLLELVQALQARIDSTGIPYDKRDYQSHITLIRDARSPGELAPLDFEWRVRDFALVGSERDGRGVVYRVLARWPLAA